jgi:hypothetical protein
LDIDPNNEKAQFRLAASLFHLRSYTKALETLRPLQRCSTVEIQLLLRQAITCVRENTSGEYDIGAIEEEAKSNHLLPHADYCSSLIEIRNSVVGGIGQRGMFAIADIPIGTLLVASKASVCAFDDEFDTPTGEGKQFTDAQQKNHDFALAERFDEQLKRGCARALYNLEGAGGQGKLDIDIRRDDVYDQNEDVPEFNSREIMGMIQRNSFRVYKYNSLGEDSIGGTAVFYVPSFFNHSCMPNTFYYTFCDMMFIRSSVQIKAGAEIFSSYTDMTHGETVDERNTKLGNRLGGFTCQCGLCKFERKNEKVVLPAARLASEMFWRYRTEESRQSNKTKAIQELQSARTKIYEFFGAVPPTFAATSSKVISSKSPGLFAMARSLKPVLQHLVNALHTEQQATAESFPFCAEYHGIVKGNLIFGTAGDRMVDVGFAPMLVYQYYCFKTPLAIHGPVAEMWYKELKRACLRVGGKKYFKAKYALLEQLEMMRSTSNDAEMTTLTKQLADVGLIPS